MNEHEKAVSIHAHIILAALVDAHNAMVKFEVVANEKTVHKKTREKMLQSAKECKQMRQRFDKFLKVHERKIMDEQILSDEDCLQIQNINQLAISVPKGIRNHIESYAEGLVKVYGKK